MEFFEFLNTSVTPFHTVKNLKQIFNPKEIKIFERNGALIAAKLPRYISEKSRFRIALAHTDYPTLKVTPNPNKCGAGIQTLHAEIYGSPLYTSWLDRDLGYGGILAYELNGNIQTQLFKGEKLFRIPQLAVHLNRGVNQEGLKVNPQNDLDILWNTNEKSFAEILQKELPQNAKLLDYEIQFFDGQPANFGGLNDEWIYSGRLDNLSSCHAIAEALINAPDLENDFLVACFFNNEEVGSNTREGASGNFLQSTLAKLLPLKNLDDILADSFAVSIDMAHAAHPNFIQKHEINHAPILGKGIVLKLNAQKRYASDVFSNAKFKFICSKNHVKFQTFVMRNDMPCGSTVGPTISANLGIPTVDIGEPMLSMHSIREMTAVNDHNEIIRFISGLFGE